VVYQNRTVEMVICNDGQNEHQIKGMNYSEYNSPVVPAATALELQSCRITTAYLNHNYSSTLSKQIFIPSVLMIGKEQLIQADAVALFET